MTWSGAALATLVTVAGLLSARYAVRCQLGPDLTLTLGAGRAHVRHRGGTIARGPALTIRTHGQTPSIEWLMIDWHVYPNWWFLRLPLWIPFLLGAGPAGAICLVRWRRRRAPGRCRRCGYLLTGLRPGDGGPAICPECGAAGKPKAER